VERRATSRERRGDDADRHQQPGVHPATWYAQRGGGQASASYRPRRASRHDDEVLPEAAEQRSQRCSPGATSFTHDGANARVRRRQRGGIREPPSTTGAHHQQRRVVPGPDAPAPTRPRKMPTEGQHDPTANFRVFSGNRASGACHHHAHDGQHDHGQRRRSRAARPTLFWAGDEVMAMNNNLQPLQRTTLKDQGERLQSGPSRAARHGAARAAATWRGRRRSPLVVQSLVNRRQQIALTEPLAGQAGERAPTISRTEGKRDQGQGAARPRRPTRDTMSAAPMPGKVERHSRVRPAASPIVSASTASTSRNETVRTRGDTGHSRDLQLGHRRSGGGGVPL